MSRQHFIKHCMEEVPVVEATSEDDMHFDPEHQMMTGPDGELYFELFGAFGTYSSWYTSGKWIKGHWTRSNKWVGGRYRSCKSDRRKGK